MSHLSQVADYGLVLGQGCKYQIKTTITEALGCYSAKNEADSSENLYKGSCEISNIEIITSPIELLNGNKLAIKYTITSNTSKHYNVRLFIRDVYGNIIAEWSTFSLYKHICLPEGQKQVVFEWQRQRLAPGKYSIEVIFYELNGLEIAASLTNTNFISVQGVNSGPAKIALGYPQMV